MVITGRHLSSWLGATLLVLAVGASAQTRDKPAPPVPPPPPSSQQFSDGDLDELYRDLYGVQMKIGRGAPSDVDSLRAVRDSLLAEIRQLALEVERRRAGLERGGEAPEAWEREFDVFVGELEDAAVDSDWDRLAEVLGEQAETWGQGLSVLGQELEGLQVDIEEDRVRIDTGSGSRLTFKVPKELKEELRRGIEEVGVELSRVLDDSARVRWGGELEGLIDELPEDVGARFFPGRHEREKTVIAESIVRVGEDVIVERDEIVEGDVLVAGGDVYVEGEVDGNVYVLFGDLFVEGRGSVLADAVSLGGRVVVEDESTVHGRRFDAPVVRSGIVPSIWAGDGGLAWIVHWSRVAVLALAIVMGFHFVDQRMRRVAHHGQERTGRDLVSGALWFAVVLGVFVVASVGLVISVIGIPIVIVLVGAFVAVLVLAYAIGCNVIGHRLLERFGSGEERAWQAALLGMALLEIPALVALAFATADGGGAAVAGLRAFDGLLKFGVLSLGVGAMVATRGGLDDGEAPPHEPELALPAASHAD